MESQFAIPSETSFLVNQRQKKGLVVFPGALGDFICFLPALRFLAESKQDFEIEIAMRSDFSDLIFHRDIPIAVCSLDYHKIGHVFSDGAEWNSRLWDSLSTYSFIYSWMGSGSKEFVHRLESCYLGELRIFPFRPFGIGVHMADYYLSCLGGERISNSPVPIPLSLSSVTWCQEFWEKYSLREKMILALAPGSGAEEKNWPLKYYESLLKWWKEWSKGEVIVFFGPAENERINQDRIPEDILLVNGANIGQVSALLSQCNLYLGNDSGITHLAAVLGIPTVAIFGPTDTTLWRPLGERVRVLSQNVSCSPCTNSIMKMCSYRRCLDSISLDDVISNLKEILPRSFLDKDDVGI